MATAGFRFWQAACYIAIAPVFMLVVHSMSAALLRGDGLASVGVGLASTFLYFFIFPFCIVNALFLSCVMGEVRFKYSNFLFYIASSMFWFFFFRNILNEMGLLNAFGFVSHVVVTLLTYKIPIIVRRDFWVTTRSDNGE